MTPARIAGCRSCFPYNVQAGDPNMRNPVALICAVAWLLVLAGVRAQSAPASGTQAAAAAELRSTYLLGPDDQITIRAVEADEMSEKPMRIGGDGYIRLPMIGRVHAAGLTVEQLENELMARLKDFIREPEVAVTVTEFRSQPVSVIGSVKNPGVHQLQGRKTLIEILSLAGGLADDAGGVVKVTRRLEWGRIPLAGAADDPTGHFNVAEVRLNNILRARNPEQNIVVRPNDVISVPRAEMVYVTGQVVRSGAFVLNERESMTALQALALAGGCDRAASPQNARILRAVPGQAARVEIAIDLRKVLANRGEDIAMKANDILVVPNNVPKQAALRAIEAAIQTGTGIAIWRR